MRSCSTSSSFITIDFIYAPDNKLLNKINIFHYFFFNQFGLLLLKSLQAEWEAFQYCFFLPAPIYAIDGLLIWSQSFWKSNDLFLSLFPNSIMKKSNQNIQANISAGIFLYCIFIPYLTEYWNTTVHFHVSLKIKVETDLQRPETDQREEGS